jgi:hypothetical protein
MTWFNPTWQERLLDPPGVMLLCNELLVGDHSAKEIDIRGDSVDRQVPQSAVHAYESIVSV